MHAVSPSFVLDLCGKIYQEQPEAWLVHIKGYDWQFGEGLSRQAQKNLSLAVEKTKKVILEPGSLNNIA